MQLNMVNAIVDFDNCGENLQRKRNGSSQSFPVSRVDKIK